MLACGPAVRQATSEPPAPCAQRHTLRVPAIGTIRTKGVSCGVDSVDFVDFVAEISPCMPGRQIRTLKHSSVNGTISILRTLLDGTAGCCLRASPSTLPGPTLTTCRHYPATFMACWVASTSLARLSWLKSATAFANACCAGFVSIVCR